MNADDSPGVDPCFGFAEAMPLIVWTAGPNGRPDHFNSRWSQYTGLSPEAGFGDGWLEAMHPMDRDHRAGDWRAAVERAEAREFECRLRRADGLYRWHLVRFAPVRAGRGEIVRWVGSMLDVDDRRRGDEALEALVQERTRELRRSNDELERFALIAAHDLQEPLRKIQAFGGRILTKHANAVDVQGREHLGRIVDAADRMRVMVDDVLALARVASERRPLVPVDLRDAAEEVVADLEVLIRRTGGRVELGALPTVRADPVQMRRLLQNLIANALKFHRPGEPPQVRVSARAIFIDGDPNPTAHELVVADDGVGFDEAHCDRIFQPFQRLRGLSEYGGAGLGLAICRRIADRHSGWLTATSAPGKGATFRITLPARPDARRKPARAEAPTEERDGAKHA